MVAEEFLRHGNQPKTEEQVLQAVTWECDIGLVGKGVFPDPMSI